MKNLTADGSDRKDSLFDRPNGASPPGGSRSCRNCKHFYRDSESWEMDHIWWWECNLHPEYKNLTSFPFKNTKCADRSPAEVMILDHP